jgi:hypothetical protein
MGAPRGANRIGASAARRFRQWDSLATSHDRGLTSNANFER